MDFFIHSQKRLDLFFFFGWAFTLQLTEASKHEFMYLSIEYQRQNTLESPAIPIKPNSFLKNTTCKVLVDH